MTNPTNKYSQEQLNKLHQLFVVEKLSYSEIGRRLGITREAARLRTIKYFTNEVAERKELKTLVNNLEELSYIRRKLTRKNNKESLHNEIIRLYSEGTPVTKIATLMNRSYDTIIGILYQLRLDGVEIPKKNPNAGNYK